MIYGFTQRNAELNGYSVKNHLDGLRPWQVYVETKAKTACVTVNGVPAGDGDPSPMGKWLHAATLQLPKGEHVVDVKCDAPVERAIVTDLCFEEEGQLRIAWGNRADQPTFEQERILYTLEDVKQLRRHGFIMHQPKDTQCMAAPGGMPLGGLGAGKVEVATTGQLTAFTGNNNQDSPIFRMPGSYFAIGVSGHEISSARLLQTNVVDQEMLPAASVEVDAAYPAATYRYNVNPLPVDVELNTFSAHVPGDAANSSIPAAWFDFTIRNRANTPMRTSLCFSWENLINVGGSMKYNSNSQRLLPLCYHTWNASWVWSDRRKNRAERKGSAIRFYADEDLGNPASFGEHAIWCSDPNVQVICDRDLEQDELNFAYSLASCFDTPFTPSRGSEFRAGALISHKELQAGESCKVRFILAWHMPNMPTSDGDAGVNYTHRFQNVMEVLDYAIRKGDDLREASLLTAKLLRDSDLPDWFVRRLLDDRFVAATCSWYDHNGDFSINEGPTGMSGCMGTLDQRAASQGYWCTFFPELDDNELESFRLSQGENGQCSHDIGFSQIQRRTTWQTQWPDLAAAYVQQVYRHWQRTGGEAFIARHWPHVKKAVQWAGTFDDANCGIPYIKKGRGTTYDNQHWEGVNAFIASVHMAMLYLTADMASRLGDPDADTYAAMAERAKNSRMEMLWDNEARCFRNAYVNKTGERDDSVFIASLAGDWYMLSAGLPAAVDTDILRDAAKAIFANCYCPDGLTDQGGRKETPAFMQYPAAYYCSPAMLVGCADEAWQAMAINDKVITTAPSTHFNQGLTYNFDGGPRWALPYYMTAPATWNLLDAVGGIVPDLRDGTLAVSPAMEGKIPVFTRDAWFTVERKGGILCFTPFRSLRPYAYRAVIADGRRIDLPQGFDPGRQALQLQL